MKRAADIALMVAFCWAIAAGFVARTILETFLLGWRAVDELLTIEAL